MTKLPLQPIFTNKYGNPQFRSNKIVDYLLKHGGLDLNTLAIELSLEEHREDWEQFAQLIGYSLSGFSELDYVSDDAYHTAAKIAVDPTLSEEQAKIAHLEELLATARKHARDLAAALFRIHPDDLHP